MNENKRLILIILTIFSFFIFIFIFFNFVENRNKNNAKWFYERKIYSIIIRKILEEEKHNSRVIYLRKINNKEDEPIDVAHEGVFLTGLWENTEKGDTLIKESNSLIIKIKKQDSEDIIIEAQDLNGNLND